MCWLVILPCLNVPCQIDKATEVWREIKNEKTICTVYATSDLHGMFLYVYWVCLLCNVLMFMYVYFVRFISYKIIV